MNFERVLAAYKKCAKGKRKSLHCAQFEAKLGEEVLALTKEINNKTYRPGVSRCFVVLKPKPREIWAAHFRDRVVHHIIVHELEQVYEKSFSSKTFACRKNMGLHACLMDFKKQVRRISKGGRKDVWALKLDIESFFVTIDRVLLKELLIEQVTDAEIRWLIEVTFSCDPRSNYIVSGYRENLKLIHQSKSWFSYPSGKGIPIGNLTSQFGANFYLSGLDHFIQRKLKPRGYLRYMDDLILLSDNRDQLEPVDTIVNEWLLENRLQKLNPMKTKLINLRDGMDYLGCYVRQVESTKEPLLILPARKKCWDLVKSLRSIKDWNWEKMYFSHELAFADRSLHRRKLALVNARLGIMKHFSSYKNRKGAVEKYLGGSQESLKYPLLIKTDPNFGKIRFDG